MQCPGPDGLQQDIPLLTPALQFMLSRRLLATSIGTARSLLQRIAKKPCFDMTYTILHPLNRGAAVNSGRSRLQSLHACRTTPQVHAAQHTQVPLQNILPAPLLIPNNGHFRSLWKAFAQRRSFVSVRSQSSDGPSSTAQHAPITIQLPQYCCGCGIKMQQSDPEAPGWVWCTWMDEETADSQINAHSIPAWSPHLLQDVLHYCFHYLRVCRYFIIPAKLLEPRHQVRLAAKTKQQLPRSTARQADDFAVPAQWV
jgi:hypothetical protein